PRRDGAVALPALDQPVGTERLGQDARTDLRVVGDRRGDGRDRRLDDDGVAGGDPTHGCESSSVGWLVSPWRPPAVARARRPAPSCPARTPTRPAPPRSR